MRYTISDTNVLEIFIDGDIPHVRQPNFPSGEQWTAEEAAAWAEAYISAMADPTAPLPGPSREMPTVERVEADEESLPTNSPSVTAEAFDSLVELGWTPPPAE